MRKAIPAIEKQRLVRLEPTRWHRSQAEAWERCNECRPAIHETAKHPMSLPYPQPNRFTTSLAAEERALPSPVSRKPDIPGICGIFPTIPPLGHSHSPPSPPTMFFSERAGAPPIETLKPPQLRGSIQLRSILLASRSGTDRSNANSPEAGRIERLRFTRGGSNEVAADLHRTAHDVTTWVVTWALECKANFGVRCDPPGWRNDGERHSVSG